MNVTHFKLKGRGFEREKLSKERERNGNIYKLRERNKDRKTDR